MLASAAVRCLSRSIHVGSVTKALRTMKVTDAQLAMVLRPGVVLLAAMFKKHQYELRVAGGAVRDLLRGLEPDDLDFATTATPTQMKEMFEEENVRMINETGEKHGTITARIEEESFQCTTLRIDVVTDGRRAEVKFTKDWYLDANRRDLTINSMFLDMDGTVYDYFNGKQHLEDHRIEFVGDANIRIQEDYLRVLRYFRFYGRIAREPNSHSQEVLDAITNNADGLQRISGERIWSELQKIVVGNFGGQLLERMVECKLARWIGLPDNFHGENCVKLLKLCSDCGVDPATLQPMTVLAAGFDVEDDAYTFIARVKCSKKERELLVFIIKNRTQVMEQKSIKLMQDMLVDLVIDEKMADQVARSLVSQLLSYVGEKELLEDLAKWEMPAFPVSGGMIMGLLDDRRKARFVLHALIQLWKEANFSVPADELLLSVPEIQENIQLPSKKRKK